MSVDEINNIESIFKGKDDYTYFVMMEGRKWETIPYAGMKLMSKINNLKDYAEKTEIRKKYGRIKIALYSQFKPPKDIIKILKMEEILLVVEDKKDKLKFEKP